jgi:serine phosphatase RsbU (regulator of sigma subunit)/DNA-binding transcriptional ArsR family regulator
MASQEENSEVVATARADAARNRERILEAAGKLLEQSPGASLGEIATAAGVSRSTIYRHFTDRDGLLEEIGERPRTAHQQTEELLPAGGLGREEPTALDPVQVLDAVAAPLLPEQLVAEAQRIAGVPLALYVIDIDGSHLLRMAGPTRLPEKIEAGLAVGPELDRQGLALLRRRLADYAGVEIIPLWLRGRAIGVLLTLGQPRAALAELAPQAAAAIAMADRYTDAFARAQRRKQPKAAAEIQQSLLPPRIARFTGAEVAGNVLPSYEVAGDWYDVIENQDGIWLTIADGLGSGTRAIASAAVALGALRASRRSDGTIKEALMVMHRTLKEMPGPQAEMSAVVSHWDPATRELTIANCGHVPPVVIRNDGTTEKLKVPKVKGLGGRSAPEPAERSTTLAAGDRLIMVSDGVVAEGRKKAGLGIDGLLEAAQRSQSATAPDTVRAIHSAVLDATGGELDDDATAVCLAITQARD